MTWFYLTLILFLIITSILIYLTHMMQDPRVQMKTLIHHIMHRHNIYKMDMNQISQILILLGEEPSEVATQIQEKIFRGVINFNHQYKDHISVVLNQEKFDEISLEIKSLMHKLLHQFYFLNVIKAWEMFSPHFQQPGLHSQVNKNQTKGQMLDDQYEKARLHYMYYGPMSVYHFNQQLPQIPPQPSIPHQPSMLHQHSMSHQPSMPSSFQPLFDFKPENRQDHMPPRPARGRPPLNKSKNPQNTQILRGRPPKDILPPQKKKQYEDSPYQPSGNLSERGMENQSEEIEQKDLINMGNCLCRGKLKRDRSFKCKCQKYFHQECVGSSRMCLVCRQAEYDPFNQVVWQIGSFLINFEEKNHHDGFISLSSHSNIFQTLQYGVMVSCAHPDYQGLCWPDDILFKINGQPIFEVPSLLQAHGQHRRKDGQLILTPYLSNLKGDSASLRKIKFDLSPLAPAQGDLPRRNNRKGTFQMCFFIVKQITPDEIFRRVLDQYTKKPRIAPYDWNFFEQVVPQTMSITVNDPYSQELIDCPVRGLNCRHLQCFDLFTFLTMNYETNFRQWQCPFCRGDCRQLLVDKYQLFLFKEVKMTGNLPKRIIFYQDGSLIYEKNENQESEIEQNSRE